MLKFSVICYSGRGRGWPPGHPHLRRLPEVLRAGRHRQVHPTQGTGVQQGELLVSGSGGGGVPRQRRQRERPPSERTEAEYLRTYQEELGERQAP